MLSRFFRQTEIPVQYQSNFLHLYFDIAWFGVLNGTTISFLSIYAIRLGATNQQIGLLGAIAAFVNLFLAIPAGHWLQMRQTSQAVLLTAVLSRLGYIPLIFLPWLFPDQTQITAILVITFLMAIPITAVGIGFNALFAEAVPNEYRAHVAGIRNGMLSITFMLTSLLSGYILDKVPFPMGYQIVFAIGALGAAMSSLHLKFVQPIPAEPPAAPLNSLSGRSSQQSIFHSLRMDIWRTPFRRVLLALFAFHLTQYLPMPIFGIYNVRILQLTDDNIGIGTALFYLCVLLGSTQIRKLVQRFGNRNLTGWSIAGLAIYPLLLSFSRNALHFYGVSILGGLAFAFVSGAYANYMLEQIPAHDRPSYLAWYTIILNGAILIGSLAGAALGEALGLASALVLFGVLRMLAAIFVLRWG